jgi:hypothetical protein
MGIVVVADVRKRWTTIAAEVHVAHDQEATTEGERQWSYRLFQAFDGCQVFGCGLLPDMLRKGESVSGITKSPDDRVNVGGDSVHRLAGDLLGVLGKVPRHSRWTRGGYLVPDGQVLAGAVATRP